MFKGLKAAVFVVGVFPLGYESYSVVVRLLEWGRAQMVRMNAVEIGGNARVGRC